MEQYYQDFSTNFMALINEIHLYAPSKTTEKLVKLMGKLDVASISKIIARFNIITNKYKKLIDNRDENLFINSDFNPIPELNFSSFWNDLLFEQKDRIWIYLQLLTIASNFIMNIVNIKQTQVNDVTTPLKNNKEDKEEDKKDDKKEKKKINFNPYEGIGVQTENLSMDLIMSGPKELPSNEPKSNGLNSLSSMLNLGKMFDMTSLANELKNIDVSQIEQATNNIKDLLGDSLDKETSEMITDMVSGITDELKKVPDSDASGNPLEKLFKIAESVAGKIGPKMKDKNIDIKKLWNSAQNLTNKFGDASNNPMSLLNNIMSQTMKMQDNFQGKTNEECIRMMESSGLGDLMKMIPKPPQNNPTRERLQKKLEEKKKQNK